MLCLSFFIPGHDLFDFFSGLISSAEWILSSQPFPAWDIPTKMAIYWAGPEEPGGGRQGSGCSCPCPAEVLFPASRNPPLPAVWPSHHWLFQDRVQDKRFFGAAFQGKLSGDSKLISLTSGLWRKWGNIIPLLENGDTKHSGDRLEQQGGRAKKGAKVRWFQSINNSNKNNLSRLWRLYSLHSTVTRMIRLLAAQHSLVLRVTEQLPPPICRWRKWVSEK